MFFERLQIAKLLPYRLLASIYGRPLTISHAWEVDLPSDVDVQCNTIGAGGETFPEMVPGASVFRISLQLMGILREILETIYQNPQRQLADRQGSSDRELLRQSLELNDRLDQFLATMPEGPSTFLATAPSMTQSRAWGLSLHEQALITRSVLL